jgi:hypothetical protein
VCLGGLQQVSPGAVAGDRAREALHGFLGRRAAAEVARRPPTVVVLVEIPAAVVVFAALFTG